MTYSGYSLLFDVVLFSHRLGVVIAEKRISPSPMATSFQVRLMNICDVASTGNLTDSNFLVDYVRGLLKKISHSL